MDYVGPEKIAFRTIGPDKAKMHPKSIPLRTPFWMKNDRHAAWEHDFFKKDERRTAWERFFLKRALSHKSRRAPPKVHGAHFAKRKTSAALHGNAFFSKEQFRISPAESRLEWTARISENAKRAPRCMRTYFLKKIERRAARERLRAQPRTVNRARPDPATQKATQGDAKK